MVYRVKRTQLGLQDLQANLDDLTESEFTSLFKIEKADTRPFEWSPETMMAISFELDQDLIVVERDITNIMDVISDIGGFVEIMSITGSVFLTIFNYQNFNNYLVSKLFKHASPDGHQPASF